MKQKILLLLFFFSVMVKANAQQQPGKQKLRIVDTLTVQERNTRNPVILKAELDSLIQVHTAGLQQSQPVEPVKETVESIPSWIVVVGIGTLLIIAFLLYRLFSHQKKFSKTISELKRQLQGMEYFASETTGGAPEKNSKNRTALEKKVTELTSELDKQKKSNQTSLLEYEVLKQSIAEAYKIKNYPGYARENKEVDNISGLLATEKSVALYAFERFLKPVIAIADANKNNPAKISKEESEKLIELLVSLSFYYSEYLYLRINDLSVGGNIVKRIGNNVNGNLIDPALLKELNKDHGSRALTLRMALNNAGIDKLSYPVFDDTDLNNF